MYLSTAGKSKVCLRNPPAMPPGNVKNRNRQDPGSSPLMPVSARARPAWVESCRLSQLKWNDSSRQFWLGELASPGAAFGPLWRAIAWMRWAFS